MADNKVLDQVFLLMFICDGTLERYSYEDTHKILGIFTRETFFMPAIVNQLKVQIFKFNKDLSNHLKNTKTSIKETGGLFDELKTFYSLINETMKMQTINQKIREIVKKIDSNRGYLRNMLMDRTKSWDYSPFFMIDDSGYVIPFQIKIKSFEANEAQITESIPDFLE